MAHFFGVYGKFRMRRESKNHVLEFYVREVFEFGVFVHYYVCGVEYNNNLK